MDALHLVDRWPVGTATAGVATGSGACSFTGDIERPFPWASLTKVLVSLALLVAVEDETVALDDPAGPPGSTVRHLLAHASGLAPDSPTAITVPGRRRIYSSAGFDLLGAFVSERSGMPFADYLAGSVLEPLGLSGTRFGIGASPAAGASGPLRDLAALATELLTPTVVSASTLATATSVAFPGLVGVLPGFGRFEPCDWGLGLEVRGQKQPHWTGSRNDPATFGHFGRAGGFLWVDPRSAVACVALSDRPFGPWARHAWPVLADAVLADTETSGP